MPERRPRIALVAPALREGGGVATVAGFLLDAIAEADFADVDVFSLAISSRDANSVRLLAPRSWGRGPRTRRSEWRGVPITEVGCRWAEWEPSRYAPRGHLTRALAGYDLVQVVAGGPSWCLAVQATGVPTALQVATLTRSDRETRLQRARGARGAYLRAVTRVVDRLDERALRVPDVVFVENGWMRDHCEAVGARRTVYAPPGVDTERFRPAPTYAAGGPIVSVARWQDPRKRLDVLLDAYARLRALVPDAPRLVLAGAEGPDAAMRERIATLGLAEHVDVRVRLSLDELTALYAGASLFALSSDEEGYGMVLAEAAAAGLPAVATRCGGPEGIVVPGLTGALVDRRAPEQLAEALRRLIGDVEARESMSRAARRHAVAELSLQACAARFLDEYARLLARP